jgi:septum site-determining protein MinC
MKKAQAPFEIKSSQLDVFALQLNEIPSEQVLNRLNERLDHLPQHDTAHVILLDLSKLARGGLVDLNQLLALLRDKNIICTGLIHGDSSYGVSVARAHGLSFIQADMVRNYEYIAKFDEGKGSTQRVMEEQYSSPSRVYPTLTIDKPIRAGQQIYAPGADLVILSSVSTGAELIADGHIHVYGALRGRALAGASGNEQARIFVQSMQAELVSIAGLYRVLDEELPGSLYRQPVQIYLEQEKIIMKNLHELLNAK